MKFQFQIFLSEEDYLKFNIFHALQSPYGAKTVRNFRIAIALIGGIFILGSLLLQRFSPHAFIGIIPMLAVVVISQLLLKRFLIFSIKGNIAQLKKKGKMAYSPSSYMEFGENSFVETTDTVKAEQKYSSIERISIVEGSYIYLHTNNLMAFILPFSSFASKEQYDEFFNFIKTICNNIDFYKGINP